jgi:hypothetical protein|tara:strand:- start:14 stop:253 length:240 start_codon:yes stop_codon:yes gene_type:complete
MKSLRKNKLGFLDIDKFRRAIGKAQISLLIAAQGLCIVALIIVAPVWAILSVWVVAFMRLSGAISRKIDAEDALDVRRY